MFSIGIKKSEDIKPCIALINDKCDINANKNNILIKKIAKILNHSPVFNISSPLLVYQTLQVSMESLYYAQHCLLIFYFDRINDI